jgi:hypothetical protein
LPVPLLEERQFEDGWIEDLHGALFDASLLAPIAGAMPRAAHASPPARPQPLQRIDDVPRGPQRRDLGFGENLQRDLALLAHRDHEHDHA